VYAGGERRERFENERTRHALGCDWCQLDGSDNFSWELRVFDLMTMYKQCCIPGLGRTTWPFNPSPRKNPLIVQNAFNIIERQMDENTQEEETDGDGV
jgi:hypothetical protein